MQKALIIRYRYRKERRDRVLDELNELLADGWRLVSATPMGLATVGRETSEGVVALFASLVVVEKEGAQPEMRRAGHREPREESPEDTAVD